MTLRWIVVALLVANLGYFAWTRGALAFLGAEPAGFSETEPHRLQQQVRPEMLKFRTNPPGSP